MVEKSIDFNSAKRALARNKFEEDFFKLMNNAMFGKTMENLRLRRSVDLVTDENKRKKLISQPTFRSWRVFNEELTAVERYKASVYLNKPIYVGFCVLELSKLVMYDFYYNQLSQMFPNMRLLFTDTDSHGDLDLEVWCRTKFERINNSCINKHFCIILVCHQ